MKRTSASIKMEIENLDFQGMTASQISRRLNLPLALVVGTLRPNIIRSKTSYVSTLRGCKL